MTTLRDRLSDLAGEVDPTPGTSTGTLWQDGRRLARRQRALGAVAALAAVAVVAVGAGAVATQLQANGVGPADGGEPGEVVNLHVPDRIYDANSWWPRSTTAYGPLAGLYPEQRATWSGDSVNDLVGVTAVGQDYRWLDLPEFDEVPLKGTSQHWSLSPSGSHVAYWVWQQDRLRLRTVDVQSGVSHELELDEGIDEASTIGWSSELVWVCPGDPCQSLFTMDATDGRWLGTSETPMRSQMSTFVPGLGNATSVLLDADRGASRLFQVASDGSGTAERVTRVSGLVSTGGDTTTNVDSAALSPDGSTVVAVLLGRIQVGPVVPGGLTQTDPLDGPEDVQRLVGWLDEDRVVAALAFGDLVSVDIGTGEREILVRFPEATSPEIAVALLGSGTVPATRPPSPRPPQTYAVLAAGAAVMVLGLGAWLRRRRVQR